jgi:hypothetical protein
LIPCKTVRDNKLNCLRQSFPRHFQPRTMSTQ